MQRPGVYAPVLLILLVGALARAEDEPQVGLSLGRWSESRLTYPGHEGQEALALPDLPEELETAAREHLDILERAEALRETGAGPAIAAEEQLLQSLDSFESFYWEIKLHQLLSF